MFKPVIEKAKRILTANSHEVPDKINSPAHYKLDGLNIESIDIIFAVVRKIENGVIAVCVANVLKYVIRAQKKNGLEDYKKARKYLDWIIKEYEKHDK